MPPSLDDLQLQPKPAIIGLARPCVARGTGSSQSADISERGPKRNLGTKPYRAEPEVRIHLPPAGSHTKPDHPDGSPGSSNISQTASPRTTTDLSRLADLRAPGPALRHMTRCTSCGKIKAYLSTPRGPARAMASTTRRLAAILAADIAGYSRLMGADEVGTVEALREHRSAADPLIAEHGGRIVKTTGDGVLIEFGSVVGAVECALALQRLVDERSAETPAERRMEWRIGIHLG